MFLIAKGAWGYHAGSDGALVVASLHKIVTTSFINVYLPSVIVSIIKRMTPAYECLNRSEARNLWKFGIVTRYRLYKCA